MQFLRPIGGTMTQDTNTWAQALNIQSGHAAVLTQCR